MTTTEPAQHWPTPMLPVTPYVQNGHSWFLCTITLCSCFNVLMFRAQSSIELLYAINDLSNV